MQIKKNLDCCLTQNTKINANESYIYMHFIYIYIYIHIYKLKTIKLLEENIGRNLCDPELGKDFRGNKKYKL